MKKSNIALALAGLLTVSGMGTLAASAADDTTTVKTEQNEKQRGKGERGHHAIDREAMHEATLKALGITEDEAKQAREDGKKLHELAEEKGITFEAFSDAMKQAQSDALAQAVKDGKLTQEQADEMSAKQEERFADVKSYDDLDNMKQSQGKHGKGMNRDGIKGEDTTKAAVLDALGITEDEAKQAREDGKKLHELAEEKGIPVNTFVNTIEKAETDKLAQAVKDGKLTQEQADEITERHESRFENIKSYDDFKDMKQEGPRGHGERGERGGFGKH